MADNRGTSQIRSAIDGLDDTVTTVHGGREGEVESLRSAVDSRAETPTWEPIKREQSLRVRIGDRIRASIITGELKPDTLYSVGQLAEQFGVSRTPVREALLDLSQHDFLRMDRNRGFRITVPSQEDIQEIMAVRRLLETPAIEAVARLQPPPTQIFSQARAIYADLDRAAAEERAAEFLILDREFHLLLISALGNKRLTRLVGHLRDQMHLPGLKRLASGHSLSASQYGHLPLLEALESGDAKRAVRIFKRHLEQTLADWA